MNSGDRTIRTPSRPSNPFTPPLDLPALPSRFCAPGSGLSVLLAWFWPLGSARLALLTPHPYRHRAGESGCVWDAGKRPQSKFHVKRLDDFPRARAEI